MRDAALAPDGRSLVVADIYCCTQLHVLSLIDDTVGEDVSPGHSVDRTLYDGTAAAFLEHRRFKRAFDRE